MEKSIARVKDGRLVLGEPTELPEGAEVPVLLDHDPGELESTPEQRERLAAILARSVAEADRGEGVPAEEVMRRLRARE